jgi:hypothetical protein
VGFERFRKRLSVDFKGNLTGRLRKGFLHFVIPDLIRNPVFSMWIPAGVYPDENWGGNDRSEVMAKPSLKHYPNVSIEVDVRKNYERDST